MFSLMTKNILQKTFSLITIIFLLACLFSIPVEASDSRSYFISEYNIDININQDGSANIEEQITYDFSGSFNGVSFDIDLSGTKGIKNNEVFVIKNGTQTIIPKSDSENRNTYKYHVQNNIVNFKVFEPSEDQEKTFVYKYTLIDAVTKYDDIAEFNRKVIGSGWEVPLENITINAVLPEGALKEDIKVFAHGPLTGESKIISNKVIQFTIPMVPPSTFIETRILFPTSLVPDSTNTVGKAALPEILKNEQILAEQANLKREEAREQIRQQEEKERSLSVIGSGIFYLLLLLWVLTIILIYLKYDKEHKSRFFGKYFRELPGEYTPAEMSVLMSMGQVYSKDIMATLMDLVRKKHLILDEVSFTKKTFLKEKQVKDYKISLNPKTPLVDLKSHESFLVNWFLIEIGDGNSVLLEDIKNFSSDKKNALDFKTNYDLWCEKVKEEALSNNFLDPSAKKGIIIGVLVSLFYLAAGIALPSIFYYDTGLTLLVLGVILLFFSVRIKRRTVYGNEQYRMWKAFRRFLKDFSRLRHAEVPSIILWEHYLVYAISLGIAQKVIKQLPLVFNENDLSDPQLTFLYGMSYGHFNNFERSFNNTINTIQSSVITATSIASSHNSSGSGSGGGFSGGSSGGGGGGGGGGAF